MSNGINGVGQNFDDFLKEQGLYEEVKKRARKKIAELKSHRLCHETTQNVNGDKSKENGNQP